MGWTGQGVRVGDQSVRDYYNQFSGDMKDLGGCLGLRAHLFTLAFLGALPNRCPSPKLLLPIKEGL